MSNTCIIFGSSRVDGNTSKLVDHLAEATKAKVFELNQYKIGYYRYEHDQIDDFLPLFNEISSYENQIYVTPVYWYSMSAVMKCFFDRISEALRVKPAITDSLKGKKMLLFNMSSTSMVYPFFELPFQYSAEYLEMRYLGSVHCWLENKELPISVIQKIKILLSKANITM